MELVNTPGERLEFNARQLKGLCGDELAIIAKDGFIPLKHTDQGSMVLAIVSSINSALMADTQMVESINSIIKLISTRCPRIDLETLSARLVIKKAGSAAFAKDAVHGSFDEDRSIKKWSKLKHILFPILSECMGVGDTYNDILNGQGRFTPPGPIQDHALLHPKLCNKDLGLALPDVGSNDRRLHWIVHCLREVARASSTQLDGLGSLHRTCALLSLRTGPLFSPGFFVVRTGNRRSELFLITVDFDAAGNVAIPRGRFQFQTLSSLLRRCADIESCKADQIGLSWAVFAHVDGHFAPIMDTTKQCGFLADLPKQCMPNVFKPLLTLDDETTHAKKHPITDHTGDGDDSITDIAKLHAGYGFDDDVDASVGMAQDLQDELGEDERHSLKRTADVIKSTGILQQMTSKDATC